MVHTQIKRVVFGAFFSLNLLVSGLKASDKNSTDVAKVVGAAIVAKVIENRLFGNGSACPVGLISERVPVKTHLEKRDVRQDLSKFPNFPQRTYDGNINYQEIVHAWAKVNNCTVFFTAEGLIDHVLKKEDITVVDSTVHRLGVQVGNIPVHVVSIPECKQLEKRPWLRRFIQAWNTDVVVPGLNARNAVEIAAVLNLVTMVHPHLPELSSFKRK